MSVPLVAASSSMSESDHVLGLSLAHGHLVTVSVEDTECSVYCRWPGTESMDAVKKEVKLNIQHLPLDPPPEVCEATVRESSSQPRGRVQQAIQEFSEDITKKFTKKFTKRFKRSRNRIPAVQNDNRGSSGVPASKVLASPPGAGETPCPKSTDDELQGAHEALEHMRTLGGPAQSVTSAADNAPAGLTTADDFNTTYLQPLKIFDTVIEKIANVHPYAKMSLGILSAAAKIILAQAQRDESVHRLFQKLDQVYGFIIQDDNLFKVESMRDVVRKIAQQTLECARFIREYSETKSFCESSGYCIRILILSLL
ncbi:uncharacterized protein EDB93DRAFT_1108997 [Suillus bovinus]|uniref:uncharacterized protein n=1 Tax=Suillus bovinus TaxID=48563 RepID=UPI001B878E59|nr:uncharacterized protein EDB93DRAFT_1108997 [Suillus bovinus]KAG2128368.1 hypothetical protein EDB93DRAFT_1108997 [Suillus bovinus]